VVIGEIRVVRCYASSSILDLETSAPCVSALSSVSGKVDTNSTNSHEAKTRLRSTSTPRKLLPLRWGEGREGKRTLRTVDHAGHFYKELWIAVCVCSPCSRLLRRQSRLHRVSPHQDQRKRRPLFRDRLFVETLRPDYYAAMDCGCGTVTTAETVSKVCVAGGTTVRAT
jgi:hypothetical protein